MIDIHSTFRTLNDTSNFFSPIFKKKVSNLFLLTTHIWCGQVGRKKFTYNHKGKKINLQIDVGRNGRYEEGFKKGQFSFRKVLFRAQKEKGEGKKNKKILRLKLISKKEK